MLFHVLVCVSHWQMGLCRPPCSYRSRGWGQRIHSRWDSSRSGRRSGVFEIQQNSDITFRLYDWGRVDQKTKQPRALQIDQAIASIDFAENTGGLITPSIEETLPTKREKLFDCRHFLLWRLRGELPFAVGGGGEPHVLVCIDGSGLIEHGSAAYAIDKGDVWLISAVIGACVFRTNETVTLLEAALLLA